MNLSISLYLFSLSVLHKHFKQQLNQTHTRTLNPNKSVVYFSVGAVTKSCFFMNWKSFSSHKQVSEMTEVLKSWKRVRVFKYFFDSMHVLFYSFVFYCHKVNSLLFIQLWQHWKPCLFWFSDVTVQSWWEALLCFAWLSALPCLDLVRKKGGWRRNSFINACSFFPEKHRHVGLSQRDYLFRKEETYQPKGTFCQINVLLLSHVFQFTVINIHS